MAGGYQHGWLYAVSLPDKLPATPTFPIPLLPPFLPPPHFPPLTYILLHIYQPPYCHIPIPLPPRHLAPPSSYEDAIHLSNSLTRETSGTA
jgi:hypothetical protein